LAASFVLFEKPPFSRRLLSANFITQFLCCKAWILYYLAAISVVTFWAWLGMKVWRHKTLHKKFKYGIPAIIIIQMALIGFLFLR